MFITHSFLEMSKTFVIVKFFILVSHIISFSNNHSGKKQN